MRNKLSVFAMLLMVAALVLSACAPAAAPGAAPAAESESTEAAGSSNLEKYRSGQGVSGAVFRRVRGYLCGSPDGVGGDPPAHQA